MKHYYLNYLKIGLTPQEIQKKSGITLELLNQADSPISLSQLDSMTELALERMDSPAEYMRISERITPEDYGVYGSIARHCKNIGEVCQLELKYGALISNSDEMAYKEDREHLYFKCAKIYGPIPDVIEISILVEQLELFRKLTQARIVPEKVLFRHSRPLYASELERIFSCPLLFEQTQSATVFDIRIKQFEIQGRNDHILNVFTQYAESLLEKRGLNGNFRNKVSAMIEKKLPVGAANIQSVSEALNMSRQSVYLKLKEEGTSFSELLQEVRKNQMLNYVSKADQSFQEISDLLGYSDVSVFYRTFKKWFNLTPKMYRKNHWTEMKKKSSYITAS